MNSLTKSPSSPPVYEQLRIDIEVNTEAAEIGFLRTLLAAHALKIKSGNLTDAGRKGLLNILEDLNSIEHMLRE